MKVIYNQGNAHKLMSRRNKATLMESLDNREVEFGVKF